MIKGTSLKDLQQQQQLAQMQYSGLQNLQYEQGHNAAHVNQQGQHAPYAVQQVPRTDQADIEDLARDISNNMPSREDRTETDSDIVVNEKEKKDNGGWLSSIPEVLREPLILVVLYVILSQDMVKNFFGKYIKQLNSEETGGIGFVGVVIYGIILAVLFVLAKRLLLK
jgi:uncharacterized protein YpuA (DUF1002 family)